jgi:hypothetical protein
MIYVGAEGIAQRQRMCTRPWVPSPLQKNKQNVWRKPRKDFRKKGFFSDYVLSSHYRQSRH